MDIDLTVEKLEQNYQRGYKHVNDKGRHIAALSLPDVIDELDNALALYGINDISIFLTKLYHIIAHQTYHIPIDERAEMNYGAISRMLDRGQGNPRIDHLERLLGALDASLGLCKIEDRDERVSIEELQRACFFEDHIRREERWFLADVIDLLHFFGLQLRVFTRSEVELKNELEGSFAFPFPNFNAKEFLDTRKKAERLNKLLRFFNVEFDLTASLGLVLRPAKVSE